MKVRTIVQIVLAVVILGLGYLLFQNFMTDIKFDNEFNARKEACAQKLKIIRTLEEAYKKTNGTYCDNFDTLLHHVMTDSVPFPNETYDTLEIKKAIEAGTLLAEYTGDKTSDAAFGVAIKEVLNMSSDDQRAKKFVRDTILKYPAIEELFKNTTNKDLVVKDAKTGLERQVTLEEIRNCRYVPNKKDKDGKPMEFKLKKGDMEGIPVFIAYVNFTDLYDDLDADLLKNLIAERNNKSKELEEKAKAKNRDFEPIYNSWRVGDTLKPETRGNFE